MKLMSGANKQDLSLVTTETQAILSHPYFYLRNTMREKETSTL